MKRSEHIEPLSQDHYQGLQVTRRLKTGIDRGVDVSEMVTFVLRVWDEHLVYHFEQEEALLVSPLEQCGGAVLAERMVAEHRALRTRTEAMREGTAGGEAIEAFAESLRAHIRFEEREVFPYLEQHLSPADLEAMGERLHALHEGTDTAWPAPSWE